MRKKFIELLTKHTSPSNNIWLLTADLGYGGLDIFRDKFPEKFLNTGAAETTMMNIAVGLTLENKLPFVYSITSFLLYRPFEVLRTYINHEVIPVKLIGNGRFKDYHHDGISHWSSDAKYYLTGMKNIHQFWPKKEEELEDILIHMINCKNPDFLSLKR